MDEAFKFHRYRTCIILKDLKNITDTHTGNVHVASEEPCLSSSFTRNNIPSIRSFWLRLCHQAHEVWFFGTATQAHHITAGHFHLGLLESRIDIKSGGGRSYTLRTQEQSNSMRVWTAILWKSFCLKCYTFQIRTKDLCPPGPESLKHMWDLNHYGNDCRTISTYCYGLMRYVCMSKVQY